MGRLDPSFEVQKVISARTSAQNCEIGSVTYGLWTSVTELVNRRILDTGPRPRVTMSYGGFTKVDPRGLDPVYETFDFAILRGRPRRFGFLNENGKPARTSAQNGPGTWNTGTCADVRAECPRGVVKLRGRPRRMGVCGIGLEPGVVRQDDCGRMWSARRRVPGQSWTIAMVACTDCQSEAYEVGIGSGLLWSTVNTGRKHASSE